MLDRGWQRILLPGTPAGMQASVVKLARGGPGLVALGSEVRPSSSNATAVAWTSAYGQTWQRSVLGGQAAGAIPGDVAAGAGGIAVVGFEPVEEPVDTPHAVFWTSADGRSWQRSAEAHSTDSATPESVAAWGAGFVAAGTAYSTSADGRQSAHVVIWRSSDGTGWQRGADDPVLADAGATQILAGPSGLLLVGQSAGDDPAATHVEMWSSGDSGTWHPLTRDPTVFPDGQAVREVTTTPAGFLAFGSDIRRAGSSVLWSSVDGSTWRRLPGVPVVPVIAANGGTSSVAVTAELTVTADDVHNIAPQEPPDLWVSPNGAGWTQAADDRVWGSGLFGVNTLVAFRDGVVAGGASAPPPASCTPATSPQGIYLEALPTSATIWLWTPEGAAVAGPPRSDPQDPRTFSLYQTDLLSGYTAGAGAYTDACTRIFDAGKVSAGVGPITAYNFEDGVADLRGGFTRFLVGMTAVAGDISGATALLKHARSLFAADANPNDAHPPKRLQSTLKIGDQTKVFLGQIGDDEVGYSVAYAVVWRLKKYIGMVAVWPQDRALAARLARAELSHLEAALR
jgi:hypothetical protein